MVTLGYSAICSLDGYVADESGNFDRAVPGEEVHVYVNELERDVGTYLYGRRMYETIADWEAMGDLEPSSVTDDFGSIWREADKIVYSTTLTQAATARTRIERTFEPRVIRSMKIAAAQDISICGPTSGASAFAALRVDLELVEEKIFRSGVVYVRYRVLPGP